MSVIAAIGDFQIQHAAGEAEGLEPEVDTEVGTIKDRFEKGEAFKSEHGGLFSQ